jgi:hypothetical protein
MRPVSEPKACSVRWNKTAQPSSSAPAGPNQPGSWGNRFLLQRFLGSHSEKCHKKSCCCISLHFSDSPFSWEVLVKDLIGRSRAILNVFTKSYVADFRNVFCFCSDIVSWHHWSACNYRNILIQDRNQLIFSGQMVCENPWVRFRVNRGSRLAASRRKTLSPTWKRMIFRAQS